MSILYTKLKFCSKQSFDAVRHLVVISSIKLFFLFLFPTIEKLNIRPLFEFYKDVFEKGLFLPPTDIEIDAIGIGEEITEYIIED